ncbi:MAG: Abortive infection protein [Acidimicrobiales bacterium]|nr:Abortive infection protein [Acidimicrobiales bacterium]
MFSPPAPAPASSPYTPYIPPVQAPQPGTVEATTTSPDRNRIGPTVVKAILLGVVLQAVVYGLTRGLNLEPAPAVVLGLGLTLSFYLVVLFMVQGRLFYGSVKPVWHIGPPGTGLVIGVGVGSLQALFVVAVASLVAGRVSSDSSASMAFAQGGFIRVAALVLIMVVAAPLVEELLFRGLLAESLRGRGRGAAIWLSALAFALWHLRPDAIKYYLLCGALLGLLYWKRGLVCSMAAHATFNGTLVLVAALSMSGPAHAMTGGGVTLSAPAGWRQVANPGSGADLELRSPSGAQVFVHREQLPQAVDPSTVVSRMGSMVNLGPEVVVKPGPVRPVQFPVGGGGEVDITDHGRDAEAVLLAGPQGMVIVELVTGGNANARAQFDSMLQSLTLAG